MSSEGLLATLRSFATGLARLLGVYLVIRAIAEPFVIDFSDPATYRNDWGGPSLIGVLAVHILPGLLAAALIVVTLERREGTRSDRTSDETPPS
jgi:hypothetical protein